MRLSATLIAVLLCATLVACGGDDDAATADAAAIDATPPDAPPPDAPESFCGQPGDPGNEIGVGKFCNTISDCSGNGMATICATLGDPDAHFCTRTCQNEDAGVAVCGTGATCVCAGAGCGCTPNSCL